MSKNLYHARTELCPDIQWPMWYKLSIEADEDNFMDIPEDSELLTNNGISMVWRGNDGWIYKQSIPFLIENEIYCLQTMYSYGKFVPRSYRHGHGKYTIRIEDLGESELFNSRKKAQVRAGDVRVALSRAGIRHGDITKSNVIVKNNVPKIIDWAESRLASDFVRADKRPAGDWYWLQKTFEELCEEEE